VTVGVDAAFVLELLDELLDVELELLVLGVFTWLRFMLAWPWRERKNIEASLL